MDEMLVCHLQWSTPKQCQNERELQNKDSVHILSTATNTWFLITCTSFIQTCRTAKAREFEEHIIATEIISMYVHS
jgi:hypothetical protein